VSTTIGIDRTPDRAVFEQSLLTPAARRYAELQARVLAGAGVAAHSRFVRLAEPAIRGHVLEVGSGAPVVLVHGGGGFAAQWAGIMKPLSERFAVYAPDRPGCGLSDPFDYRSVEFRSHAVAFIRSTLDVLDLPRVSLVGSSMGGYWSIAFALAHPERVDRLALVGAQAGFDRSVPLFFRLLATPIVNRLLYATVARPGPASTRRVYRSLVADVDRLPAGFLDLAHVGETVPGAIHSWLTMLERVMTLRGFRRELMLRNELARVAAPTLFIWGDRDAFASPSSGREACQTMPNARLEVMEGGSHLPFLDDPGRCAALMGDFLGATS